MYKSKKALEDFPLKNSQKKKSILHEIRGFTYRRIQKAFFRLSKTRFLDICVRWAALCPLGGFFAALLAARDLIKSPGFSPQGYLGSL
jgi:hypothetical protein